MQGGPDTPTVLLIRRRAQPGQCEGPRDLADRRVPVHPAGQGARRAGKDAAASSRSPSNKCCTRSS
ncbi:hypothetical protein HBB16_17330 [Pseudonocardia sp. MCCB 268]|nr:hypothetical protein [Pseudonocardia cytotoxica]